MYVFCSGSVVEALEGQCHKQLCTLTIIEQQVVTAPTVDGGIGVVGQDTSKCNTVDLEIFAIKNFSPVT